MELEQASPSSLLGAAGWIEQLLVGSVATIVAMLAVAGLGFLMLAGRMPVRRGIVVVTGCFILFSSRLIASGLMAGIEPSPSVSVPPSVPSPLYVAPTPPAVPADPYAGAAVPAPASDMLQRQPAW